MPSKISFTQLQNPQSVTRLLIVLAGAVFLIELLVMLLLDCFPPLPKRVSFLLDATLLSALIFPVFYFLVFRPLCRNIAQLQRVEDELRTISVVFDSKDPILITDSLANILRANKMFLNISGYSAEELIGKNPRILQAGRYGKDYYKDMWRQLLSKGSWSGEARIKDKQGRDFPIGMTISAVKNAQQQTTHYVAIYNL